MDIRPTDVNRFSAIPNGIQHESDTRDSLGLRTNRKDHYDPQSKSKESYSLDANAANDAN